MKDLSAFVAPIKGFTSKTSTHKLEVFAWYLHQVKGRERVTAAELAQCFDELHEPRPSNVHGLLSALCNRKPSRLIKDSKGYRVAAAARVELQQLLPMRHSALITTAMLAALEQRVVEPHQKAFLHETLICYGHGAYRAAIVMAWNLAYSHVCNLIFNNDLIRFNEQLSKVFPKAGIVTKRSDFEDHKESRVVEVARGAGILSASSAKVLTEKLGKRNTAAHPSSSKVTSVTAEEVIHDLVENIILRTEL